MIVKEMTDEKKIFIETAEILHLISFIVHKKLMDTHPGTELIERKNEIVISCLTNALIKGIVVSLNEGRVIQMDKAKVGLLSYCIDIEVKRVIRDSELKESPWTTVIVRVLNDMHSRIGWWTCETQQKRINGTNKGVALFYPFQHPAEWTNLLNRVKCRFKKCWFKDRRSSHVGVYRQIGACFCALHNLGMDFARRQESNTTGNY